MPCDESGSHHPTESQARFRAKSPFYKLHGDTRLSAATAAAVQATISEWQARPYQGDALDAFDAGKRRQMLIWHRRAGKDNYALNLADRERRNHVGTYWHMYPFHVQAKRAIWNGIDNHGVRFIDQAFPHHQRTATRNQDMQIEFENGSMWQLCGSDAYDRLVGANPRGVIFSEWALCDPRSWEYIRPIIRENGGFVVFITTYRGRNHAYRMAKRLKNNPEWYIDIRTVDDTTHIDGRPILTPEDIQAERDEGMSEALIRQEYYCDPMAAVEGAIYGRALEQLILAGRAGSRAYDASRPVFASWSLEWDDQYTVVFCQHVGNETIVVGSKSYPYEPLSNCIDDVRTAFPWRHCARHIVPAGTSKDAVEIFEKQDFIVDLAPKSDDTFKVTRDRFGLTWIDQAPRTWCPGDDNNELFVDALNGYAFTKGREPGTYINKPANTWEKHYARAFEVYSTWRHGESDAPGGWHSGASYDNHDRRVI